MQINQQEEEILKIITEYHLKTNGKCGIGAVDIANKMNLKFIDIRDSLNNLNDLKLFKIRKGINHILIFKK